MKNQRLSIIKDEGYQFKFPLSAFSNQKVNFFGNVKKIETFLAKRNVFYCFFDKKRRELLIRKINSLSWLPKFALSCIRREKLKVTPISIFVYGSYLYGDFNYLPDDIDVGIVVKGCFFKGIIDKIKIPFSLRQKSLVPAEKISLFVYGEDNMNKGISTDDTIVAGLIHKKTTLRELSIAYWRNVVIWGRDFNYLENNERNILVTLARMIEGCYIRLFEYGNGREDELTCFRRIATRLVEVNIFLKFLYPKLKINKEYLKLPCKVISEDISYSEMRKLHDSTLLAYKKVKHGLMI